MQNNKRRRNDHGRDGRDAKDGDTDMIDSKAEEPPEDPLKNATTLYVGNLSVALLLVY
jgi:nuclear cap-binding protein subunit 2